MVIMVVTMMVIVTGMSMMVMIMAPMFLLHHRFPSLVRNRHLQDKSTIVSAIESARRTGTCSTATPSASTFPQIARVRAEDEATATADSTYPSWRHPSALQMAAALLAGVLQQRRNGYRQAPFET
jgi:hypothetical protein